MACTPSPQNKATNKKNKREGAFKYTSFLDNMLPWLCCLKNYVQDHFPKKHGMFCMSISSLLFPLPFLVHTQCRLSLLISDLERQFKHAKMITPTLAFPSFYLHGTDSFKKTNKESCSFFCSVSHGSFHHQIAKPLHSASVYKPR